MSGPVKINIVGLGYVGTATALYLAELGHTVVGWDIEHERVENLMSGELGYGDADLVSALERESRAQTRRLSFVRDMAAFTRADLWIVAVGTPQGPSGGLAVDNVRAALSAIFEQCARLDDRKPVVLVRSTMQPGTFAGVIKPLVMRNRDRVPSFEPRVAYFPEFMREGHALADSREPALLVLGADPAFNQAGLVARAFGYREDRIQRGTPEVVEFVKLGSNALHALKVTFANELASVASAQGVASDEVLRLITSDRKLNISPAYLSPGFAYGGPCLSKDLASLSVVASQAGVRIPLIGSIEPSNDEHVKRASALVLASTGAGGGVGILGLSFKLESVDLRGSKTMALIAELKRARAGLPICCWMEEPVSASEALEGLSWEPRLKSVLERCDTLVLGARRLSAEQLDALAGFEGAIIDLGFDRRATHALQRHAGYRGLLAWQPQE